MPCESGAFSGRKVAVYYAIACPENKPTADDYKRLGMMRGKTLGLAWETADATGDMSPERTQENLSTYKNVTFSGDGVSRKEQIYNQSELKRHAYNPGLATSGEPYVWFKIVSELDITEGCFMINSWDDEAPHDDVATWSMEAASAGAVEVRDVTPVITVLSQPAGASLAAGDTLTLNVIANVSDGSTLTYQWKKGATNVAGATAATYTKASVVVGDAGSYTCVISSPTAESVTSAAAVVTVS